METFLNATDHQKVTEIHLAQGETKVVRLEKFNVGQPVAGRPGIYLPPEAVVFVRIRP